MQDAQTTRINLPNLTSLHDPADRKQFLTELVSFNDSAHPLQSIAIYKLCNFSTFTAQVSVKQSHKYRVYILGTS